VSKNRDKKNRREVERLLGDFETAGDQQRLIKAVTVFVSKQKDNIQRRAASYENDFNASAKDEIYAIFKLASNVLNGVAEQVPAVAVEVKALIDLLEAERRIWLRTCVEPYFSSLTRTGRVLNALRTGSHRPARGFTARCDD
jgi:hypothetical protein